MTIIWLWFLRYQARQNFLSFWAIFCPFTPLTTQKIKILKKLKTPLEILSFYTSVPQMKIKWYMVPEIWSVTDRIFCHFGPFFPFYSPMNLENKKKQLEILSFYTNVPRIMIIGYTVPEIWCMTCVIIFDFGLFFPFHPPYSPKNQNFTKMKNQTHVKKVEHTSKFLFGIYWWTWKTNYY